MGDVLEFKRCPRCGHPLGPKPIFLGKDGEDHICGDCWSMDRNAQECDQVQAALMSIYAMGEDEE